MVFVKWPGPLYAPPRVIVTMALRVVGKDKNKPGSESKDMNKHEGEHINTESMSKPEG